MPERKLIAYAENDEILGGDASICPVACLSGPRLPMGRR